mmetsp:Transcript_4642/g.6036  ORF Transcript_4642/g.6036 Transcript_4642/m.6036 type:complete len:163 (+) Transcript_4642:310-798(+)
MNLKHKKEKAVAAKKQKEEMAKLKAEQARLKAEEEMKKEAAMKELVAKKYARIEQMVQGCKDVKVLASAGDVDVDVDKGAKEDSKKRSHDNESSSGSTEQDEVKEVDLVAPPSKKLKVGSTDDSGADTSSFKITAPVVRLLAEADKKCNVKYNEIRIKIHSE